MLGISENTIEKIVLRYLNSDKFKIEGVSDTLDTLKEIGEWIETHAVDFKELSDIKDVDKKIKELSNKVDEQISKNFVEYSTFQEDRKTIQLDNYDSISGIATDGTVHNLVMLSKWNVADFGATGVHVNLNGKDPRPTYNDDKEIALLSDVESVSEKHDKLSEKVENLEKEYTDSISDIENINSTIESNKKELEDSIKTLDIKVDDVVSSLKSEIIGGATEDFNTLKEIEDWVGKHGDLYDGLVATVGAKASTDDLNNVKTTIENSIKEVSDNVDELVSDIDNVKTNLNDLSVKHDDEINEINKTLNNKVDYFSDNKSILLANHGMILGTPNDGEQENKAESKGVCNIAMLSKWNVVDLGSVKYPINLNGVKDRPTYNDDKDIALIKDLEKYVDYKEFTYTNSEGDTASRRTIQLNNYDSISGIDTNGNGHNLVMLSKWNVADFGAKEIHLNLNGPVLDIDKNGIETKHRPSYNDNEKLAFISDIDELTKHVSETYQEKGNYITYSTEGERKIITFNNNDIIGAIANTDRSDEDIKNVDGWVSLIHLNRWNVVDIGSPKTIVNINTPSEDLRPTVQVAGTLGKVAHQIAYTSDFEDVDKKINELKTQIEELKNQLNGVKFVDEESDGNNI